MAAKVIETLITELSADGAKFKKELDKSMKDAQGWGQRMKKITGGIAIGGIAGAAAAGAGLLVLTKRAIENADALSKQSQSTGVAIEQLSGLQYAAEMSGVSNESLSSSLNKLNKNSRDAYTGVGEGAKAFDALNISVKNSDGTIKGNSELLTEVANKFASMPDGVEKSAYAMDIFGKSGAQLIPLLNGGAAGIKQLTDEAGRLGLVVDKETGKAAEQFNDSLAKMDHAMEGLGRRIAKEALPSLNDFTANINDPKTQEGLANIATGIIKIAESAVKAVTWLGNMTKELAESAAAFVHGPSVDDLDRLQGKLAGLELKRKYAGRYKDPGLDAEIAHYKELIKLSKEMQERSKQAALDAQLSGEISAGLSAEGAPVIKPKSKPESPLQAQTRKEWEKQQQDEITAELEKERKFQESRDKDIAAERDKYSQIHEAALEADKNLIDLENFRAKRQSEEMQHEYDALVAKYGADSDLASDFQKAQEEQELTHQARLQAIKDKAADEERKKTEAGYSALIGMAESYNDAKGKSSNKYTAVALKGMEILASKEKRDAVKSVARDGVKAIQKAWGSLPFPENLHGVALATAASAANFATVTGIAHGGMDYVPAETTFRVAKGERIVSPKQNKDLTNYLSNAQHGSGSPNIQIINQTGVAANAETNMLSDGTMQIILRAVDSKLQNDLGNGRGVWGSAARRYGWSTKGAF